MFSTIDMIFHNHHLISQTVTTLSLNNQLRTPTTTSLQHLKSLLLSKKTHILLLHIKFYGNEFH